MPSDGCSCSPLPDRLHYVSKAGLCVPAPGVAGLVALRRGAGLQTLCLCPHAPDPTHAGCGGGQLLVVRILYSLPTCVCVCVCSLVNWLDFVGCGCLCCFGALIYVLVCVCSRCVCVCAQYVWGCVFRRSRPYTLPTYEKRVWWPQRNLIFLLFFSSSQTQWLIHSLCVLLKP